MQALDPDQQAVFLDTDAAAAKENGTGSALSNTAEADAAMQLAAAFVRAGVRQQEIGIMSPYRSQVGGSMTIHQRKKAVYHSAVFVHLLLLGLHPLALDHGSTE